jgi:hypothetical protein
VNETSVLIVPLPFVSSKTVPYAFNRATCPPRYNKINESLKNCGYFRYDA